MVDVGDETRVLGPWVLLAPLAHGGMGSVFIAARADPAEPRTLCLVKTLKTGLASVSDYRPRFLDESRIAVLLRHEHLCQVFGGGEADGEFFLAMELIEGLTFKRLVALLQQREKQLSPEQAAALVTATLRGLHAAHTATGPDGKALGVVHRDVSPHNVMVDVQGHIKVIDFGLATSVLKETFTESAVVLGKSGYMAPEQARGEDVTPSVDQYAAAIVLYELLTDDRFYGEMQSRQIWSVVGSGNHVPRAWAEVPARFQPILKQALSPRPEARFPSCAAFADALVAACPEAALPATLESLGGIVRRLKPDELDLIAHARVALAAWDASPGSRSVGLSGSGPTERLDRVDVTESASVGRTSRSQSQSQSQSAGSATRSGARRHATVPGDADPPTAETSATAMDRPSEFARPRRRSLPLAASAGIIATVALVAVVVGVGLGRGSGQPTTTTTTTPVTIAAAPVPAPPLRAPDPTTPTTPPAAPTTPAAPTLVAPPKPPPPAPVVDVNKVLESRTAKVRARMKKTAACAPACIAALPPVPKDAARLSVFEQVLSGCEAQCQ